MFKDEKKAVFGGENRFLLVLEHLDPVSNYAAAQPWSTAAKLGRLCSCLFIQQKKIRRGHVVVSAVCGFVEGQSWKGHHSGGAVGSSAEMTVVPEEMTAESETAAAAARAARQTAARVRSEQQHDGWAVLGFVGATSFADVSAHFSFFPWENAKRESRYVFGWNSANEMHR